MWVLQCKKSETHHVWILELVEDGNVIELDVEVLVDALEDAADLDVVLELDRDLLVDEGFKEAARESTSECVSHPWLGEGGGQRMLLCRMGFSWMRCEGDPDHLSASHHSPLSMY